jgi:hypothetical protein
MISDIIDRAFTVAYPGRGWVRRHGKVLHKKRTAIGPPAKIQSLVELRRLG